MNHNLQQIFNIALGGGLVAGVLVISLMVYLFFCYCNKRICEKCGMRPGLLIWAPILNVIPLFRAAQMSGWWFLVLLIPLVGEVLYIVLCVKLCQARGKGILAMLVVLLLPVLGFPYLAFSR